MQTRDKVEQLCKLEMKSGVCITVENSPNPSCVYIRLCKHRKKVFYCFYEIFLEDNSTKIMEENAGFFTF